ncbi:3-hydroxybutyrate dehydrogenase [Lignipirellula cremea]|uniref:D-beta-hydroxybutyrate dehydrogenase n=1 Tax=Lignipirellula cremea TaxID=2528010 RepID=A0A518DP49_9BACT|nr:3-hydroxybutyrate dehydrogenase [Lignipirellula cremea]QDU93610.1 D-beta-hydroxybutyrate dehydrogenase [Lignipirellula cremea]
MSTPPALNILISGAGSGLGRGLAQELARQGHTILATDYRLEAAAETVDLVAAENGAAQAFALDVTDESSVRAFFASAPPVDVLLNNAGLQHVEKVADFPPDRWDRLLQVLLTGSFLLTQAALPGMRERGFGRIVNIGSIHSLVASPGKSAYVAAKHGLLGLAKVVALETGDVDITCNTICPAYIRTPLVDAQIADQARVRGMSPEEVIDNIMLAPMPKKAFITIAEVAATVAFLISPLARNITAQAIAIDGGWTSQ